MQHDKAVSDSSLLGLNHFLIDDYVQSNMLCTVQKNTVKISEEVLKQSDQQWANETGFLNLHQTQQGCGCKDQQAMATIIDDITQILSESGSLVKIVTEFTKNFRKFFALVCHILTISGI